MSPETTKTMLEFRHFTPEDRESYEEVLFSSPERGCEFSFANLYLWGRQKFAKVGDSIVLFSQFDRKTVYPFPVVRGDMSDTEAIRTAIDAVIRDAAARGIPCRITGLTAEFKDLLHDLYPDRFCYHCDAASADYVYDINDLADLKGRKFHSKKNHVNRFRENYPDIKAEPLSESNIEAVRELIENWYAQRSAENPESDYLMEKAAITKALTHRHELAMESLVLMNGDRAAAVTFGSRISPDTVDVHFEKADPSVQGAYAAVNCEFANYIRAKYPEIRYLNREEDMGIEGLRKAKQSYHPHHMVQKCWAHLLENGYDY